MIANAVRIYSVAYFRNCVWHNIAFSGALELHGYPDELGHARLFACQASPLPFPQMTAAAAHHAAHRCMCFTHRLRQSGGGTSTRICTLAFR